MKRRTTEQEFLKWTKKKDFRNVKKEDFINYINSMSNDDPEVIKARLAQFPDFVKFLIQGIDSICESEKANLDACRDITNNYMESLISLRSTIEKRLSDNNLTPEVEVEYIKTLNLILENMDKAHERALESNNKNRNTTISGIAMLCIAGLTVLGVSVLPVGELADVAKDSFQVIGKEGLKIVGKTIEEKIA